MKTIYLLRHGQTEWNVEGRMQGRLDSALTSHGQQQAIGHGEKLKALGGVEHMFVSPSGRTQETAYLLNSFLGAAITFDEVLMERDCGLWGGMTINEIKERFPSEWESRSKAPYEYRPPGGENTPDMIERVRDFVDRLHGGSAQSVAIVTHAVMSRAILTHLLGLKPTVAGRLRHPNEAFYQLEVGAESIRCSYFLDGKGPTDGLLHDPVNANVEPLR
ncbi:MAG: histidine phosphatase family protein [Pseudomonadales bacterium]